MYMWAKYGNPGLCLENEAQQVFPTAEEIQKNLDLVSSVLGGDLPSGCRRPTVEEMREYLWKFSKYSCDASLSEDEIKLNFSRQWTENIAAICKEYESWKNFADAIATDSRPIIKVDPGLQDSIKDASVESSNNTSMSIFLEGGKIYCKLNLNQVANSINVDREASMVISEVSQPVIEVQEYSNSMPPEPTSEGSSSSASEDSKTTRSDGKDEEK